MVFVGEKVEDSEVFVWPCSKRDRNRRWIINIIIKWVWCIQSNFNFATILKLRKEIVTYLRYLYIRTFLICSCCVRKCAREQSWKRETKRQPLRSNLWKESRCVAERFVETTNRKIRGGKTMTEFVKKKKERKRKRLGSDRRENERARSRPFPSLSVVATNAIVEPRHHPPRSRAKGHDEANALSPLFSLPPFLFYVARGLREHTTRTDDVQRRRRRKRWQWQRTKGRKKSVARQRNKFLKRT